MPKRCRSDSEVVGQPSTTIARSPYERSSDTWYRDGNIVLQAGNTQFKVHQGLLERQSTVFSEIFSQPQKTGEETVEGCRVVDLEESDEDVQLLLTALYEPRPALKDPVPFKFVSAMMRMGLSYQIPQLCEEALERLTIELPTTLEEYDQRNGVWTSIVEEKGLLIKIVNLAHERGIHTILPAAYFRCLSDMDAVLHGELLDEEPGSPRSEAACLTAVRACVAGRESLYAAFNRTFAWAREVGESCDDEEQCFYETRPWLCNDLWNPVPKVERVLLNWKHLTSKEFLLACTSLCEKCLKEAQEKFEVERPVTWKELPGYFGLPKWEDLNNP
ncbi:hypothetical protein DFP72DRAFT_918092 [Ephemerocybe angulata]|uniref:BTB domain-containing protein n=1 Tax=Ephemerocybe angulata TaxID=980116 RepID=A0A8H6HLC3_9AGAR|nr:hypothetical protein DFP72DRAFT_918092 [Tulosesus angulatus]